MAIDSQQVSHRDNGRTAVPVATMLPISGLLWPFVTPPFSKHDSLVVSEGDHVTGFSPMRPSVGPSLPGDVQLPQSHLTGPFKPAGC